jgi:hypothetical protein
VQEEEKEVYALQERGEIQVMEADEGGAGARDEDTELVEEGVEGVELAVGGKWRGREREEKGGRDALVYGVFCDVDEEEGEHVWEE